MKEIKPRHTIIDLPKEKISTAARAKGNIHRGTSTGTVGRGLFRNNARQKLMKLHL